MTDQREAARAEQSPFKPRILPFGDSAVMIEVRPHAGYDATQDVNALNRYLAGALPREPGWERPVPGANTLMVPVDPVEPGVEAAMERLSGMLAGWRQPDRDEGPDESAPLLEIPVSYGGPEGPDLAEVARAIGLTPSEVIELHAGTVYTVAFSGFIPGFAYLGPLSPRLVIPRRDTPRARVPAGSVAIGGSQTAVYPLESPGGWWLIGRTKIPVWDPMRTPPALIRPGVRVRFVSR